MADFKIDSRPKDPFEKVKVEDVISKQEKEDSSPHPTTPQSRRKFIAALYLMLKKFVDFFSKEQEKERLSFYRIKKDLTLLYSLFERLSKENLKENSGFLNELSFFWVKLNKDLYHYKPQKEDEEYLATIKLIEEIDSYPKGEKYTLGYYLSHFAGFKWVPFPFLEMIENVHHQYREEKEKSHLGIWIKKLEDIIQTK